MDTTVLSSSLGYMSILCWLGAQFPQVIVNIQTQSVEGLALPFLVNWLFGDITNLVGCILTHQLPFQTYLATYFVFVDVSLVTQYFYYYKPPIPYSPSPSPSPSPTLTLTPTAVLYSSRSLTRPHSRSRLLERSINELEAGYGLHARARSAPRAGTGSARFSGVMYAYPPTGFLPTSDLAASGSDAVKFHRADHRPSLSSLKRRLGEGSEKAEAKTAVRTRDRIGSFSEDSAQERDKEERGGEEEEELPSALVDSFYSDISGPLTGRHVSWGRDTAHPRHTSAPAVPVTAGGADTGASGSGEATETGFSTPTQTLGASKEEIRQRSRSRGRPSTRTRAYPTITYDFAPSTSQGTIQPLPPRGVPEGLAPYGDPGSSARAHRELELGRQRQSQSHSKSGSRRRTASIVFLSVGLGALLAFGSEPSTTMTTTMKTTAAVDLQDGIANVRGRVLGWNAVTDRGRHEDSVWQQNEPSFIYVQHEEPEADRRKHRPHARPPLTPEQKRRIIGRISAWSCTTLYLTSRLPQIWKNYTRKSVEGLSLALFVFAFLGNAFYVASLLSSPVLWTYPPESQPIGVDAAGSPLSPFDSQLPPYKSPRARDFLRESLPYLLGSGGTLCFDVVIVTQGIIYGRQEELKEEDMESDEEEEECEEREGVDELMDERREGEGERERDRLLTEVPRFGHDGSG